MDINGNVWVTSPDGALTFNAAAEKFTEYKSVTYKNEHGTAVVYGLAADRVGNGWWLLMSQDLVDYSDINTGKSHEFKLPAETGEMEHSRRTSARSTPSSSRRTSIRRFPGRRGRAGWERTRTAIMSGSATPSAAISRGSTSRPRRSSSCRCRGPKSQQPYEVAIDKDHNVWTNMWSTDLIGKYDQCTGKWTLFDLPNRGSETRYISLLERDGKMEVVLPYSRTRKVAVMTFRSEADLQALKAQAQPQ